MRRCNECDENEKKYNGIHKGGRNQEGKKCQVKGRKIEGCYEGKKVSGEKRN